MRLQYCQLLRSTHFTHKLQCAKAQDCFPVPAFDLIRERYVVATTSKATSCARFRQLWRLFNVKKRSFHLTATCSKNRGCLQSVGRHESSCHGYYIIHGLAAFFRLRRVRFDSPSTTMDSRRQPKKREADSLGGEGGFKSLLRVPTGRGEWQILYYSTPSLLKWVGLYWTRRLVTAN